MGCSWAQGLMLGRAHSIQQQMGKAATQDQYPACTADTIQEPCLIDICPKPAGQACQCQQQFSWNCLKGMAAANQAESNKGLPCGSVTVCQSMWSSKVQVQAIHNCCLDEGAQHQQDSVEGEEQL